jgi:hypothetical protein
MEPDTGTGSDMGLGTTETSRRKKRDRETTDKGMRGNERSHPTDLVSSPVLALGPIEPVHRPREGEERKSELGSKFTIRMGR